MVLVQHIVDIQVTPLTPEDAGTVAEREKQERVRRSLVEGREIGELIAELGLIEEDVDAIVEQVRQGRYDARIARRKQ